MDSAREQLLYEAKNPRRRGVIEGADIVERRANPSCGDVITVYVKIAAPSDGETPFDGVDPTVTDIKFDGQGCVVSMAGAAIMAEQMIGKSTEEIVKLGIDEVRQCLGADIPPMRVSCATLALEATKRGITLWKTSSK